MLDLFWYGLQFSILAMVIVLFTLYLLALLLMLFNKFTAQRQAPGQGKGGQAGKGAPTKSPPVRAQAKGEPVPAVPLQGEKPEIVAAAMGALLFALEGGQGRRFTIAKVTGAGLPSSWGQMGRSRLLQLRQDFVFSKRGKVK